MVSFGGLNLNRVQHEVFMRISRIEFEGANHLAFYSEAGFMLLERAARKTGRDSHWMRHANLLDCIRGGFHHEEALQLNQVFVPEIGLDRANVLTPIPRPNKLLLLAGNYAEHVKERGDTAVERSETFPYVFMKPPSTTLNHPWKPVVIPKNSPLAIDWELELGVIIGKEGKNIPESQALGHVAGYTIINDISNRKFRPNPLRKKRDRDVFFDWLHGKWHDSFCPMGPCVVDANSVDDPQSLALELKLNGETRQKGSTGQMIFSVAQIIEFISSMMTLEPGDIISTGTPSGVGSATGTFLKPDDVMQASISGIGTLVTRMVAEA